jgi:hypothetical protein
MGVKDSVLLLNPNTGKTIVQGSESLWALTENSWVSKIPKQII